MKLKALLRLGTFALIVTALGPAGCGADVDTDYPTDRNKSREIVALIVKANSARDKPPELLALRDRLEELLILMRLAKEVRAFKSFNSFQFAVEQVVSVCRQNEGWLKSTQKV